MSTTTTFRVVRDTEADTWQVVGSDGSTRDYPSRAAARLGRQELAEQAEATAESTPAEDEPVDDPTGGIGADDLPRDPEPESTPTPESDPCGYCEGKGMETTSGEPSPTPCPNCGAVNADAKVKAAKPAGTGQSEFARKLQPGQRIVLRGVGTVTVSSVSKVKGVQKVLVVFITEADEQDQRELWVNSKYRLVA